MRNGNRNTGEPKYLQKSNIDTGRNEQWATKISLIVAETMCSCTKRKRNCRQTKTKASGRSRDSCIATFTSIWTLSTPIYTLLVCVDLWRIHRRLTCLCNQTSNARQLTNTATGYGYSLSFVDPCWTTGWPGLGRPGLAFFRDGPGGCSRGGLAYLFHNEPADQPALSVLCIRNRCHEKRRGGKSR